MMLHLMNIRWWLHSPCYWDILVFSFSFWFIFYCLCTNHYCASSMIFFSPLNAHFLLSTMCVHSPTTCTSHNNFLASYYTWSRVFISSTHHSWCNSVISQFVANDCFFILGLLCHRWLSFRSLESYLHKVFFSLFFVDYLFLFFFVFGLCLLVVSFALYFWWMASHPWFLYTRFFFLSRSLLSYLCDNS